MNYYKTNPPLDIPALIALLQNPFDELSEKISATKNVLGVKGDVSAIVDLANSDDFDCLFRRVSININGYFLINDYLRHIFRLIQEREDNFVISVKARNLTMQGFAEKCLLEYEISPIVNWRNFDVMFSYMVYKNKNIKLYPGTFKYFIMPKHPCEILTGYAYNNNLAEDEVQVINIFCKGIYRGEFFK